VVQHVLSVIITHASDIVPNTREELQLCTGRSGGKMVAQPFLLAYRTSNGYFPTVLQGMAASLRFYSLRRTILRTWDCRCAMHPYSYRIIRIHICVRTINYSSIMTICLRSTIDTCVCTINYSPIYIYVSWLCLARGNCRRVLASRPQLSKLEVKLLFSWLVVVLYVH